MRNERMPRRTDGCQFHLEKALEADTLKEKDFHIRQALQIYVVDDEPENS